MEKQVKAPEQGSNQTLKRVLPLSFLIFYGIAYVSPTSVFGTFGLVNQDTHGMIPLTYLVATCVMAFTAFSYKHMSSQFPYAGSVYTYTSKTVNPHGGFLCGWAILVDYMLLPMVCYLLAAIYIKTYMPGIPTWVIVVAMIFIVSVINYRGIEISAWANNLIVIIQWIFMLAFLFFLIKWITTGDPSNEAAFSVTAFFNSEEFAKPDVGIGAIFSGASVLALAFLGFDSVSTLAEEAVRPKKDIGTAIVVVCIFCGCFNGFFAYLMNCAWPNNWFEVASADNGAQELMIKVCGSAMGYIFTAVYVIACIACSIAAQGSAARILYGMGRDGLLPKKVFAHVHEKYRTPTYSIIVIAVISLIAIFMDLNLATSIINFGALLGFTMVNVCVIVYFFIKKKNRGFGGFFKYLLVPLIGAVFCSIIFVSLDKYSLIIGGIWLLIGAIYLAIKTKMFRELPPEMNLEE